MSILFEKLIPTPTDDFGTPTSDEQAEVEESIQAFVESYQNALREKKEEQGSKSNGKQQNLKEEEIPVPTLNKKMHVAFLRKILDPLPSNYLAYDSTRCWLIYWVAHSCLLMGFELGEPLRSRAITTLLHFQNQYTGGFGGGHGQNAHLMGTYASVMALAILGGPGPCPDDDDVAMGISVDIGKGGWDAIDRKKLYTFLLSLKQPDGSFTVNRDGEVDVRATYCVTCVSLMLGIATPELMRGVGNAIANCQTYEGGLSSGSQPFDLPFSSPSLFQNAASLGEAHGGYAFCAMATHLALSLLPNPAEPNVSAFEPEREVGGRGVQWHQSRSASSSSLDVDRISRWSAWQQGIPIEGGGFRGRTNKLVDGCYGWFSGAGLGTILSAQLELQDGKWWLEDNSEAEPATTSGESDGWESVTGSAEENDVEGFLFDRKALQEYILVVAQAPQGGLRDKPGKRSDAYHTANNLAGLSLCQHRLEYNQSSRRTLEKNWKSTESSRSEEHNSTDNWRKECYLAMMAFISDPKYLCILGSDENRLGINHPIFNVPLTRSVPMLKWAYGQV